MITLQMASIPERKETLTIALNSLLGQVDKVRLILNNYEEVPLIALHEKVEVIRFDNSLEDGCRFLKVETNPGLTLICDDDIYFPPDFVGYMLGKYMKYGGILSIMGKNIKPRPIQSFYRDEIINYKTFGVIEDDFPVEVPAACGMIFGREAGLSVDAMKIPNSDICVAVHAKQRGIPCRVVAHSADFVKNLMPMVPNSPSIFGKYCRNDKILTDYVNAHL